MARLNVNPTRMELSKLKKRLATATRGHKLLKDKQDELMRRFIDLIKYNNKLRGEVEDKLQGAFKDFLMASAAISPEFLEEAISYPKESISLELAEVEKSCQLMADEIEKTRRRVNALEYMTIPQLQETIKYIKMKLDENERGALSRLMKVKDMMEKAQAAAEQM